MPLGKHYTFEGLLLEGTFLPVLRTNDGSEWRLDMPFFTRVRPLYGRRLRVEGTRGGFDILNVKKVTRL